MTRNWWTRFLKWVHAGLTKRLAQRGVLTRPVEYADDESGAVFPETPNGERFVVWTRGTIDTITNDGKEAGRAWERVTKRAGVHRFWDRTHHAGIPRGLRTELVIPLGSS